MKVSIIGGGGLVGSMTAYALQCGGVIHDICLLDANQDQAKGQALDLLHGASLVADQRIHAGDYGDIASSNIVVITAGLRRKPDESRLDLINRGVSRGDAMQLLRRKTSDLPGWLPSLVSGLAIKFEKMLMAAGVSIPTGKLMVTLLIAPIALFFAIILFMIVTGVALGGGRLVMIATFAGIVGALVLAWAVKGTWAGFLFTRPARFRLAGRPEAGAQAQAPLTASGT